MVALIRQLAQTLREQPLLHRGVLAARRMHANLVDRSLNIQTAPDSHPARHPLHNGEAIAAAAVEVNTRFHDPVQYDVMDYPLLRRFLKPLDLQPDDVVFDLGCGMGRMLCVAARMGVQRCVGIEASPALAERARENARSLRSPKSPIEIRQADAASAEYSGGTVYCLFNPFGRSTLEAALDRLRESLDRDPRPIRIGYHHPAHADLLDACAWLERYDADQPVYYRYSSAYWRVR